MNNKIAIFGIQLDAASMAETIHLIQGWLSEPSRNCRYVVTPNVDHIVKLQKNELFKQAYSGASLVVADGKPLVWAAKLLGEDILETVPGSDLVPALFADCNQNNSEIKVFLLGAAAGVADVAKVAIHKQWNTVNVVGTYSPEFGFDKSEEQSNVICNLINESGADLLVLGLGAPKQEIWVHQYAAKLSVKVALCVGATIDFMAGEKSRAPVVLRNTGLEWVYRMLSEPKRLGPRYLVDAFVFPWLFIKECCSKF